MTGQEAANLTLRSMSKLASQVPSSPNWMEIAVAGGTIGAADFRSATCLWE